MAAQERTAAEQQSAHSVQLVDLESKARHQQQMPFPIGVPNDGFSQYFVGRSYFHSLSMHQLRMANMTFEPSCRTNWHLHHAKRGGGQILICVAGRGFYQEEGSALRELHPGDVIHVPPNKKHWHGAALDSWFSHVIIEVPGENPYNEWCEPVSDEQYNSLAQNNPESTGCSASI